MESLGISPENYSFLMALCGLLLGFLLNLFVVLIIANFRWDMQVFNILGVASFDYFFSICVWFMIYFVPIALVLALFTQKFFKWDKFREKQSFKILLCKILKNLFSISEASDVAVGDTDWI